MSGMNYDVPEFELPVFSAVIVSRLVYYFAEIRDIVKKHEMHFNITPGMTEEDKKLKQLVAFDTPALVDTRESAYDPFPAAKLKNPVTFAAVKEFLIRNKGYFKQPDITTAPEFVYEGHNDDPIYMLECLEKMTATFDADIVEFDDKFAQEGLKDTELVYAIIVNRSVKEITVLFRGTVSPADILVDANFFKKTHPYIEEITDNGAKMHTGFFDYLCEEGTGAECKSQFDQILDVLKQVYEFKERDYSDFSLRTTGHSLGGGLAQILSFLLAGTSKASFVPKPVRAITIASPVVGDSKFREAYRKLEQEHKVRHIRISNAKDMVCGNPFFTYVQTGVNIHLYENSPADVGYFNTTKHTILQLVSFDPLGRHSVLGPGGYFQRLYKKVDGDYLNIKLLNKSIEQLYEEYADLDDSEPKGPGMASVVLPILALGGAAAAVYARRS